MFPFSRRDKWTDLTAGGRQEYAGEGKRGCDIRWGEGAFTRIFQDGDRGCWQSSHKAPWHVPMCMYHVTAEVYRGWLVFQEVSLDMQGLEQHL